MEEKYIVAIEPGSSKIKGALGRVDKDGGLTVLAIREVPVLESIRYGQIRNVEEVSNKIGEIIGKLEVVKAISPRRIKGVYVGLSGLSVNSTLVEQSLSYEVEKEIGSSDVEKLIELSRDSIDSDRDIYQVLPIRYVVDNTTATNPVGYVTTGSVRGYFNVVTGVKGIRSNINRVIRDRLNLDVEGYICAPTALADTILTADEKQLGCMMLDFGAETTTVLIYKKGALVYLATLPMGSRNITRDITFVSSEYLEDRAEKIKWELGVSPDEDNYEMSTDDIQQTTISKSIKARVGEIIANILAQIEYADYKASDLPSGIIITGGGARLKGFSELLSSRSRMKVRAGVLPNNISIADSSVLTSQNLDIISLLETASLDPTSCIEPATQKQTTPLSRINDSFDEIDRDPDEYNPEDDLMATRIGREDLEDDPLDENYGRNPQKKERKRPVSNEPKKPGIVDRLRARISTLLRDPEDSFDKDFDD